MGNIIVKAFLDYIEKNPKVLEDLIARAIPLVVDAIMAALKGAGPAEPPK